MDEKQTREDAIGRYENGESAKNIYQSLRRSKTWFYKWLKRYQLEGKDWAESRSRKPRHIANKVESSVEEAVVEMRKQLEGQRYAQVGALNIRWHLEQQGIRPPSIPTIARIIRRNNLVRKKITYEPKGTPYPGIKATHSNHVHQFDILGPRYLRHDGRFYAVNIIDAFDRRCSVNPSRRQTRLDAIRALIRCWQVMGKPTYLQMDNKLPLRTPARHPRSFSMIIRLCLKLEIQPLFIPISEPWRNGIIEHFQNDFDKMFYRPQYFKDFKNLSEKAKHFELFHNQNHRYSTLKGKTPFEKCSGLNRLLSPGYKLPKRLEIPPGYVHLIRFIRSDRILSIFGETYSMPGEVEYEYVKATIDTENETLKVYHDAKLIKAYKYRFARTVLDLTKIGW